MKIVELELNKEEDITIIVNGEDFNNFTKDFNSTIEDYIDGEEGYMYLDDILAWIYDELGIDIQKKVVK